MHHLRVIGGSLLLILAAMKVIGMVALLFQGTADHSTAWFVKQCVYAAAALIVGLSLLKPKGSENTKSD